MALPGGIPTMADVTSRGHADPDERTVGTAISTETALNRTEITARDAGRTIARAMKQILIYEEDYLTRTLLRDWLSEAGYGVYTGTLHNPHRKRTPDLVIVSVYMPKNAGALWIGDVKRAHPGRPLIAISGQFRSGLSAGGATAQSLGVQQVIAKPLIHRDLLEAVQGIIGVAN
jgi:DNA-binding NtrC family response regulator